MQSWKCPEENWQDNVQPYANDVRQVAVFFTNNTVRLQTTHNDLETTLKQPWNWHRLTLKLNPTIIQNTTTASDAATTTTDHICSNKKENKNESYWF